MPGGEPGRAHLSQLGEISKPTADRYPHFLKQARLQASSLNQGKIRLPVLTSPVFLSVTLRMTWTACCTRARPALSLTKGAQARLRSISVPLRLSRALAKGGLRPTAFPHRRGWRWCPAFAARFCRPAPARRAGFRSGPQAPPAQDPAKGIQIQQQLAEGLVVRQACTGSSTGAHRRAWASGRSALIQSFFGP
jgi:hypothetical protein